MMRGFLILPLYPVGLEGLKLSLTNLVVCVKVQRGCVGMALATWFGISDSCGMRRCGCLFRWAIIGIGRGGC